MMIIWNPTIIYLNLSSLQDIKECWIKSEFLYPVKHVSEWGVEGIAHFILVEINDHGTFQTFSRKIFFLLFYILSTLTSVNLIIFRVNFNLISRNFMRVYIDMYKLKLMRRLIWMCTIISNSCLGYSMSKSIKRTRNDGIILSCICCYYRHLSFLEICKVRWMYIILHYIQRVTSLVK